MSWGCNSHLIGLVTDFDCGSMPNPFSLKILQGGFYDALSTLR